MGHLDFMGVFLGVHENGQKSQEKQDKVYNGPRDIYFLMKTNK